MQKHGKKIHMYASKSCAAIYDDFRNSPERAAHDLDTYIFTFTKIVMLSLQFSEMRPAFLKAVFQCESFDVGLIRVRESPEVRVMVLSRLIHLFCTYLTHCGRETFNCFLFLLHFLNIRHTYMKLYIVHRELKLVCSLCIVLWP